MTPIRMRLPDRRGTPRLKARLVPRGGTIEHLNAYVCGIVTCGCA